MKQQYICFFVMMFTLEDKTFYVCTLSPKAFATYALLTYFLFTWYWKLFLYVNNSLLSLESKYQAMAKWICTERWIGRGTGSYFNIKWHAWKIDRSHIMWIFMLGFIEGKVYRIQPPDINDLMTRNQQAVDKVSLDMLNDSLVSYRDILILII